MNDVQRLEIKQDTFYEDALILLTCAPKQVPKHIMALSTKYNISKEAIYYRIRTKYGDTLANVRYKFRQPNADTLLQLTKLSTSSKELQVRLGLTDWEFIGIYDRVLGVSTFSQAKMLALKTIEIQTYNPSPKDNESMIYGMRLGDGSYDYMRKALRIEHSEKQQEWLQTKVNLFKLAYPFVSTKIVPRKRSFGNTFVWYSRKLAGSAIRYNEVSKLTMARNINQFGLFILFLDDGNLGRYGYSSVLGFTVESDEIGQALISTLSNYGFAFSQNTEHYIRITRQTDIQTYLNEMILPFNALIPDSMKYKSILKV